MKKHALASVLALLTNGEATPGSIVSALTRPKADAREGGGRPLSISAAIDWE